MATSKLQRQVAAILSAHFRTITILENSRPEWCLGDNGERLELDFFLPELNAAIEVQGQQHYEYVPHFHVTPAGFEALKGRDAAKKQQCERIGVTLFEIQDGDQVARVIDQLQAIRTTHANIFKGTNSTELRSLVSKAEKVRKRARATLKLRGQIVLHQYKMHLKQIRDTYHDIFSQYGAFAISSIPHYILAGFWTAYNAVMCELRYVANQELRERKRTKNNKSRSDGGAIP